MLQNTAGTDQIRVRPMQRQEKLRTTVRDWLEQLMDRHGVSRRQLAVRAGMSPSTIYRALEQDGQFVMSTSKLAQIADAFGEEPPAVAGGAAAGDDYRRAVWNAVFRLAQADALAYADPKDVAEAVVSVADWLAGNAADGEPGATAVVSYQAAKLRRRQ